MQESTKMKSVIKARGQHHVPAFKSFMSTIQVISSFAPGLNSRISNSCTRAEVHSNEKFSIEMKINISAIVITDIPPLEIRYFIQYRDVFLVLYPPRFWQNDFKVLFKTNAQRESNCFLSSRSSVALTTLSKSTSIRSAVCPGILRIHCNKIKQAKFADTHLMNPVVL